ncbi:MAG: TolC family protein [Sulfurimonas sp.]|uniref:TolC family protein n=1 Tax=Sulfurimonas sp. TaxID=2022749 RepID=UPI0025CEED6B|nr:TolC family protein [Sulfurimonas sp.]MCK9491011.1 TolC family protein [Sulfurimonas sp.]
MIKILLAVVLISASLFAQNFDAFLDNALKSSPYLRSSNLEISQAKEQGRIHTRYENPTLDLVYSRFKPDGSKDENGYSVSITQPIRLWGVSSDADALSNATIKKATSSYALSYAEFIRDLSLLFTEYADQRKMHELSKEELEIAKHIYEISVQRNMAGTISKGEMLQSQVDFEMVEIKAQTLNLDIQEKYFTLLEFAGISQEIELEFTHEFKLAKETSPANNPEINFLLSYKNEAKALSQVGSHKVKWVDISAEYENEPDQDVFRVGASIPLAIFNDSKQEMQIAKLEADKTHFLIENQEAKLSIEIKRLNKQRDLLLLLKSKNEKTLKTQIKLLDMFEDGYKIASINLLELQNIKNRVIQTKESLIEIETSLSKNIITNNYLIGVYND